jgi:hypothetical protein
MSKRPWFTCIPILMLASSYTAAWAADSKPDAKVATPATATAPAATLDKKLQAEYNAKADTFLYMVSYGEAEKNPIVLLSAVKLLDDLPFSSISTTDEKGKEVKQFDRDTILLHAKEFAAGDTELLAVITKIQEAPVKSGVRGHDGRDHYGRYEGRYHDDRYHGGHFYYERPMHDRYYERRFERQWDRHHHRWDWR